MLPVEPAVVHGVASAKDVKVNVERTINARIVSQLFFILLLFILLSISLVLKLNANIPTTAQEPLVLHSPPFPVCYKSQNRSTLSLLILILVNADTDIAPMFFSTLCIYRRRN
jgi:hypothetical protein